MDRPNTPSRPPDYSLPSYDDDHDTPTGQNSAAVRLLTSVEDPVDSPAYVEPPLSPLASVVVRGFSSPSSAAFRFHRSHETSSPPPGRCGPVLTHLPLFAERPGARKADTAKPRWPGLTPSFDDIEQFRSAQQITSPASVYSPQKSHNPSAKLQRRQQPRTSGTILTPIREALPHIPDGPSDRLRLRLRRMPDKPTTLSPAHCVLVQEATMAKKSRSHSPLPSTRAARRSYQPSVTEAHSRSNSILDDAPAMPPPDSTYVPFASREPGTPRRPWTPSTRSPEYARPPASTASYEPSDINGSPRPGTPSSRYGGSPRRPLPPAPLFSNSTRHSDAFADDATVSIPLDGGDDVFGPGSDLSDSRPLPMDRDSFMSASQETLSEEPDAYEKFEHYGPAPDGAQERRGVRAPQMSKKEVQLINGELVLECKIPTILYSFLPRRSEIEFTHMRYTAVTCDPDDFVERGYKLRQSIGRTTRETELFICITMYNEDEFDFTRTMHAVMKNIAHFCSRSRSRTWGENGWQKIVVCIISDGREKIHPRTLDALAAMGVYQHGIAKNYVNNRAVQAHVYEYTTQVSLDSDLKFKGAEKGIVPCQMIFCLKEKNQRKLNSHRWFFNAFGKALNPNVCILLDVGTRPGGNSLYHLWKSFDTDSNVAGACGEIKAMKGRLGSNLLNPLVASQNFEYKMSNILDKPLESVFGYITVLPGALSAYRYHALQNDETGHGPLSQYFKGETLHGQHADVFTANMYLAEDRILCWELVAKRGERWVLKYVKGCTGETDVPGKFNSTTSAATCF